MKISVLTFALLLHFFYSCNNHSEISNTDIFLAQKRADDNMHFYYRGEEYLSAFKEIIEDKSSPWIGSRVKTLYTSVIQLERKSSLSLKLIHDLQIELLKSQANNHIEMGENSVILKMNKKDNITPISFNLFKISTKMVDRPISHTENDKIIESLVALRKSYTEILASSLSYDERKYFFHDPNILKYKSEKELNSQITKAIEKGNVGLDDREVLKKVYFDLTEIIVFLRNYKTKNWLQSFELLNTIESTIYKSRIHILQNMRYRFTGCDWSFNRVTSTIFGPSIVKRGKKITIEVCIAAFSSDKQPIVKSVNGTLIETKEGKGFVEVLGDKPGYKTVKGTISIANKSGIPKTIAWEKEILVVD